MVSRTQVQVSLAEPCKKAAFLTACTSHSGDWLAALPVASCGWRTKRSIRVAVAFRLGLALCVPHPCHCGTQVDAWGLLATVCKHAPGRIMRHQATNDIVAQAFVSAAVRAMKESTGLSRRDGKRDTDSC